MNKLTVNFCGCFGIKSLSHDFHFPCDKKIPVAIVYAPNGTMKTSFAKTFDFLSRGSKQRDAICDEISGKIASRCEVEIDGKPLDVKKTGIYVVNGEEFVDASKSVASFLSDQNIAQRYNEAVKCVHDACEALMGFLRTKIKNAEDEIKKSFGSDILSVLGGIEDQGGQSPVSFESYFDFFGDFSKVEEFLKVHWREIDKYVTAYRDAITKSKILHGAFGTSELKALINGLGGGSFFTAGHRIVLRQGRRFASLEALKAAYKSEVKHVCKMDKLAELRREIEDALEKSKGLRQFKKALVDNPDVVPYLVNYSEFRRTVWRGYVQEAGGLFQNFRRVYQSAQKEIEAAKSEASKGSIEWVAVLREFKTRFHVPFTVKIDNEKEIFRGSKVPAQLSFVYEGDSGCTSKVEREKLEKILSKGEARAFRLMQIIFELRSRKREAEEKNREQLIIFDDVVDSFDYRNKYAIVEYVRDIASWKNFHVIVLTHNFDLYRLLQSRLGLSRGTKKGNVIQVFMAHKDSVGVVSLLPGQYLSQVFDCLCGRSASDLCSFFAMIPFVRNLIECIYGIPDKNSDCADYQLLTKCLHWKTSYGDISSVKIKDVFDVFGRVLKRPFTMSLAQKNKNFIEALLEVTDEVLGENLDMPVRYVPGFESAPPSDVAIENKLVLAMAIRILAEKKMFAVLKSKPDSSNQFGNMAKKFIAMYASCKSKERLNEMRVLKTISVVTPEYIHVNAFMYESLIDTGMDELRNLYKEVRKWQGD